MARPPPPPPSPDSRDHQKRWRAQGYTLDAGNEDNVRDIFARIEADIGALDLVICNVGGNVKFPLCETTARVFRKVWEMACFAGFLAGREAAACMVPRGWGAIFLTGASASMRGTSGYAAFSAAKAGQRALAQSMAKELGPQNIHVSHLVIDAGVDTAYLRYRIAQAGQDPDALPADSLMNPTSVAEATGNSITSRAMAGPLKWTSDLTENRGDPNL